MSILNYLFYKSKINQFNQLKNNNFLPLTRADLIFVKSYSIIGKLIRIKGISDSGRCKCNHIERYLGNGKSISQHWTIKIQNIKQYFHGKHEISIWHNKTYTQEQRNTLISNSLVYVGRSYDFLSIFGHFCDWIFRTDHFAKKFNFKYKTNCSEFATYIEKTINSNISNKLVEKTTPDDIYDYISNHPDWEEIYSI